MEFQTCGDTGTAVAYIVEELLSCRTVAPE